MLYFWCRLYTPKTNQANVLYIRYMTMKRYLKFQHINMDEF